MQRKRDEGHWARGKYLISRWKNKPLLTNIKFVYRLWFCSYPFSPSPRETLPSLHAVTSLMKKKTEKSFLDSPIESFDLSRRAKAGSHGIRSPARARAFFPLFYILLKFTDTTRSLVQDEICSNLLRAMYLYDEKQLKRQRIKTIEKA